MTDTKIAIIVEGLTNRAATLQAGTLKNTAVQFFRDYMSSTASRMLNGHYAVSKERSSQMGRHLLLEPVYNSLYNAFVNGDMKAVRVAAFKLARTIHAVAGHGTHPWSAEGQLHLALQKKGTHTVTLVKKAISLHFRLISQGKDPMSVELKVQKQADSVLLDKALPQKIKALFLAKQSLKAKYRMPNFDYSAKLLDFAVFTPDESDSLTASAVRSRLPLSNKEDYFIRPCPEVPNHGMKVAGFESYRSVGKEATADAVLNILSKLPEGSGLMVMKYINAATSGVLTPGQVTIGAGHDGVTAGTSQCFTFPISRYNMYGSGSPLAQLVDDSGEQIDECEIEFVVEADNGPYNESEESVQVVQFRRAPAHVDVNSIPHPDAVPGFVPAGKIDKVTNWCVVENLDDLDGIEKMIDALDGHGVVFQPQGSLQSHASAHSRVHGVAFVNSHPDAFIGKPLVDAGGGWVVPNAEFTPMPFDYNLHADAFWSGAEHARSFTDNYKESGKLSYFFHEFVGGPINDPASLAFLSGIFVGWLANAATAACIGEIRHYATNVDNDTKEQMWENDAVLNVINMFDPSFEFGGVRSDIYTSLQKLRHSYESQSHILRYMRDNYNDTDWSGSYGGENWGNCANYGAKLCSAIADRDMSSAIKHANSLENAVHNNGSLFNKFIEKQWLDLGTSGKVASFGRIAEHAEAVKLAISYLKQERQNPVAPDMLFDYNNMAETIAAAAAVAARKQAILNVVSANTEQYKIQHMGSQEQVTEFVLVTLPDGKE